MVKFEGLVRLEGNEVKFEGLVRLSLKVMRISLKA